MRRVFLSLTFALVLLSAMAAFAAPPSSQAGPVEAQPAVAAKETDYSPEVRRKASQIAREVMSPFCPGRTVSDCTSEYAAEWRREILVMVQSGRTSESIVAELSERAGRDLSGIPERRVSFGLPLMLSLSAGLVLVAVFSWLRGARRARLEEEAKGKPAAAAATVDDERLASELTAIDDD